MSAVSPSICERCTIDDVTSGSPLCASCLEEVTQYRARHLERALPPSLRDWTLDGLDSKGSEHALDAARRFAVRELDGLVFTGPVGVGKTTRAAATVRAYLEHRPQRWTRWLSVPLAVMQLDRPFKDPERVAMLDALTESRDVPIGPLVLDDLDKARPTQTTAEQLFTAIDLCITRSRPLLVTTNLMPSELAGNWPRPFGEAIASLLVGYCEVHRIEGNDRRAAR